MSLDSLAALQSILPWIGLAVFSGYLAAAAIGDVQFYIIKDKLNLFGLVTFLLLAIPMGLTWQEAGQHMLVGVAASLVMVGFFGLGWLGGGDAKMIGAMAFWVGPTAFWSFVFAATLAGGVLAMALLVGRFGARRRGLPKGPRWLRKILRRGSGVPYGVALAVGGLLVAPQTAWYPQTSPF